MSPSPRDLTEMAAAIEGTVVAARQWLQAGFSPGDAAAYVRAGCFDVDRTAELRSAHISPSHIAALGLGWDYCAGKVPLSDLSDIQAARSGDFALRLRSPSLMLW
ncbi:MAG: hypothetical protein B7Z37_18055 [Verrucomicrobia bacterium 12-59-8]|nr:MAG: hypothetical protein B7Z37_18055 [Verrucomicrobia bacterium 12-59-8]